MKLHDYQIDAVEFFKERLFYDGQKGAALFLDLGLGKTAITLEFLSQMKIFQELERTLIVAPLLVCEEWPQEIRKWGRQFPLSHTMVAGNDAVGRLRAIQRALLTRGDGRPPADLTIINPEVLKWFWETTQKLKPFPWKWLVVDEITLFKDWTTQRMKTLRQMLPHFTKRIGLTGTPAAESMNDLFSQAFILDDGSALGTTITQWRRRYCYAGGYKGYTAVFDTRYRDEVYDRIAPLVLRMKNTDYLDMPPRQDREVWVTLPPETQQEYDRVEEELWIEIAQLDNKKKQIDFENASSKYHACRGLAGGGLYDREYLDEIDDRTGRQKYKNHAVHIHEDKLDALSDILDDLDGPALVAYQYDHDRQRIQQRYPEAPAICSGTSTKDSRAYIQMWNRGLIPMLLVQPGSLSYGVNMQAGGNDIIWYTLPDSLTKYIQLNGRIYRQGVQGMVRIWHLLTRHTVDEVVWTRNRTKAEDQDTLLDALENYRRTKQSRATKKGIPSTSAT